MRWAVLALALLGAPALAGSNKAANAEFVRQVTVASARVAQVEQALLEAEARVEQLEEVVRLRGQQEAERLENLDQVNAEINRLRGQIEEQQFVVDDLKAMMEQTLESNEVRMLHAELRLAQIEEFLKIEPPPVPVLAVVPARLLLLLLRLPTLTPRPRRRPCTHASPATAVV